MGKGLGCGLNWSVCNKTCFCRGSGPPVSRTEWGASVEPGGELSVDRDSSL